MPHLDSKDEYVSVDGNHSHTHDDVVLQWSNDDAVIRSNEHHRIRSNEYTSSSPSSPSSTAISLRAAIQEAVSIAGIIIPQSPPYQLTSPPVSPHKALLPHPRTYEVSRYATATSPAKQQTTATRQSFNNALLEPDVMEPDQLLDDDDTDRSRSVGEIYHYRGGGGADSRDGGGDDGSDDNGRSTVVSFSRPLLSPKKVQRGYFHAMVDDGQHHQFYDSGGSGSCEPLHNG
jgi:hypothetical protein